jgi:3'-phosphoadenosine 5'-phosphosulfate (PAPS) 3'-phosphatase
MGLFHGLAEVYFHSGIIKKWDLAAAEGIVKSTCYGKFTGLDGSKIDYR